MSDQEYLTSIVGEARERRDTSHHVYALRVDLRYRGNTLGDVIEVVESQGWRLEHVSATSNGGGQYTSDDIVLLVFRRNPSSHPATGG